MCAWYAGSYECAADTELQWAVQTVDGQWGRIESIRPFAGYGVGNPVLDWNPVTRALTIYFSVVAGTWWTDALLLAMASQDSGTTWERPHLLMPTRGLMARTSVVHVKNGTVLLPIYHEQYRVPLVLLSTDQGKTWEMTGDTTMFGHAIQPAVVELPDDTLAMFTRTDKGFVYVSYSFNHGKSWTMSQPTALPNPNSSIAAVCLHDGAVLMALNPSDYSRDTLALATSRDGGVTWSEPETIVHKPHAEYSYPAMQQMPHGLLHLVFTENRARILHGVFTPGRLD